MHPGAGAPDLINQWFENARPYKLDTLYRLAYRAQEKKTQQGWDRFDDAPRGLMHTFNAAALSALATVGCLVGITLDLLLEHYNVSATFAILWVGVSLFAGVTLGITIYGWCVSQQFYRHHVQALSHALRLDPVLHRSILSTYFQVSFKNADAVLKVLQDEAADAPQGHVPLIQLLIDDAAAKISRQPPASV